MEHQSKTKQCQNCKQEFVIEPEDFDFYEKIKVPAPTFCPECRMKRRMVFRNERTLYKRSCDFCKKDIVTIYNPVENVKVYCSECWWSDKWDPMNYGRNYDFSKPFFEQFKILLKEVPKMALEAYKNENSPYTNFTWFCKNVYLSPSTIYSDNIMYSHGVTNSQDSIDCTYIHNSQLCYETLYSTNCSNSIYLIDSRDCIDCKFLYDCRGCSDCFMSSNLRNGHFVFRNKQLSKDEYHDMIREIDISNYQTLEDLISEYQKLKLSSLHRFATVFKTVNSTGNNLNNAKNAFQCFTGNDIEDVRYAIRAIKVKDSMDLYGVGDDGELLYEGVNVGYKDSFILFSSSTFEDIRNAIYCDYCRTSQNIFGCVGLRKKQYCILNKQYTKEEYEKLILKIKKHMDDMPYVDSRNVVYKYGEFFPSELSPFAYNEAIVKEYFPMDRKEVAEQGYRWRDSKIRDYKITKTSRELPACIKDVDDSIFSETIECEHEGNCDEECTTAFKITEPELRFYKKIGLPIPRLCPNCRHFQRAKQVAPLNVKLWHRHCMKPGCTNEFETPYSPDRSEIIYCEECYNKEVA